jgi:parallel beta-helix repeat protein
LPVWGGVFYLNGNKNYIKINGFRINGLSNPTTTQEYGIRVDSANHIQITNNLIAHTGNSGIYVNPGDNILIDNNEVSYPSQNLSNSQEGVSCSYLSNSTISNNKVHHGGWEGIDTKHTVSNVNIFGNELWGMKRVSIYVDGFGDTIDTVNVYNNIIHDHVAGDGIRIGNEQGGADTNINIYNNIIYNLVTYDHGINVTSYHTSGSTPTFSNIAIFNNTLHSIVGGGVNIEAGSGIVVSNNILSNTGSYGVKMTPAGQTSNNLFYGISASGTNAVTGDPAFANAVANDFHLQSNSLAIDHGTSNNAPTMDIDLQPRPQGASVDMGAYEYSNLDTIPPSTPMNLVASAPTSSTVNLSWSVSTDNVGVAGYRIYRNGTEVGTSTVASFADTSVAGGTAYAYTIIASDVTGNLSAFSNTATVNVPAPAPLVNITSYYTGNITANSATINWTTNLSSTGVVSYGTSPNNLGSHVSVNSSATSQLVQLTELAPNTIYYYNINVSSGAASALSTTASFKTAASLPDVIVTWSSYASGVFKCTVKNQGAAATPAGVVIGVGYSVDGVWRTWGAVPGPLAAGASVTIGTNGAAYTIPRGTHKITAYADDVNRFAESNETNNTLTNSITVK